MAFSLMKQLRYLVWQDGNYVRMEDRTDWSAYGIVKDDIVQCLVWGAVDGSFVNVNFVDDDNKEFIANILEEIYINMFIIYKWKPGGIAAGEFRAYNDSLWLALTNTTTVPGTSTDWTEITSVNVSMLDSFITTYPDQVVEYLFKPVYTTINGDLNIEKVADNEFRITWHGSSPIVSATLRNYRNEYIDTLQTEPDGISVSLEEDGVYIVSMTLQDGSVSYVEIYNFTSAEKCFLDLVINVFCSCADCNDCGGENYDRMINFLNTYTIIRDMVYVDRAVNLGLTATDIIREDYLLALGVLVDKLRIMTSECTCNNE